MFTIRVNLSCTILQKKMENKRQKICYKFKNGGIAVFVQKNLILQIKEISFTKS